MSLSTPSREMMLLSRQLGRQCLRRRPLSLSLRPRSSRNPTLPAVSTATTTRTVASFTAPHHAGAISVIKSSVDTSSDEFKENERLMGEAMARLDELTRRAQQGGSAKAREKHLARKKMLPRDRVTALIDPGTTFLELAPLAGHELYPEAEVPAAGVIAGVGVVEGVTCMIVANDSTVKGGTYYPITVKKHLRAQAVAQENNLPWVSLWG
jgi:3-methylcrotonyl-CoA carboxylase beta subunit